MRDAPERVVSRQGHRMWQVPWRRARIIEALVLLVIAWHLVSRWYLPRWANGGCARGDNDPVSVLAQVPWWLRLALDDCDIADAIVRACWGP